MLYFTSSEFRNIFDLYITPYEIKCCKSYIRIYIVHIHHILLITTIHHQSICIISLLPRAAASVCRNKIQLTLLRCSSCIKKMVKKYLDTTKVCQHELASYLPFSVAIFWLPTRKSAMFTEKQTWEFENIFVDMVSLDRETTLSVRLKSKRQQRINNKFSIYVIFRRR